MAASTAIAPAATGAAVVAVAVFAAITAVAAVTVVTAIAVSLCPITLTAGGMKERNEITYISKFHPIVLALTDMYKERWEG
jgi:hypothetical protein